MKILAYIPEVPDSFWIACSKEEAEKWFVPLLEEKELEKYNKLLSMDAERKGCDPERDAEYNEMVKEMMGVDDVAYVHFCVSRTLAKCYAGVAHHPFHQLWNGYSPFCRCDHVEINTPDDLKDIVMTLNGKPIKLLEEES